MSDDDKLTKFLNLVPRANWRQDMPRIWNEQLRQALSDNLVTVGWGGALILTDAGRAAVSNGTRETPHGS